MYKKLLLICLFCFSITSSYSACDIVNKDYIDDNITNRLYLRENLKSKNIDTASIFTINSGKYQGLYNNFVIGSGVTIGIDTGVISATDDLTSDIDTTYTASGPQIDQNITYDINYKVQNFNKSVTFNYTKYSKTNFPITLKYKDENLTHVDNQPLLLNYYKHNKYITIEYERVDSEQKSIIIPEDKFTYVDDTNYTDVNLSLPITYKPQSKYKTINFTYKDKNTTLVQNTFNNSITYTEYTKSNYNINITYPSKTKLDYNITLNYSDINSSTIDDIDLKSVVGFENYWNFSNASGLPSGVTMNTNGIISGSDDTNTTNYTISFDYKDNTIKNIDLKTNLKDNNARLFNTLDTNESLSLDTNGILSGSMSNHSSTSTYIGFKYKNNTIKNIDIKKSSYLNNTQAHNITMTNLQSGLTCSTSGIISGTLSDTSITNAITGDTLINYKDDEIVDIDLKTTKGVEDTTAREFIKYTNNNYWPVGTIDVSSNGILTGSATNHPSSDYMYIRYKNNEINNIYLKTKLSNTDAREFNISSDLNALVYNTNTGLISGTLGSNNPVATDMNITLSYKTNKINNINLMDIIDSNHTDARQFTNVSLPSGLSVNASGIVSGAVNLRADIDGSNECKYYRNTIKDVNLSSELEEQYSSELNSRIFSKYYPSSLPSGLSIQSDKRTISGIMTTFDASEQGRFYYYTNYIHPTNSTKLINIIDDMNTSAKEVQNQNFSVNNLSLHRWNSSDGDSELEIWGRPTPDNEMDLIKNITFSLDYYASNEIEDILLPALISDDKARNFINYKNLPNVLLENKDGKIYGTVDLRPADPTINIDFEYYNSTIDPIDIHNSTYTNDPIARYFTKQTLVDGLSIDYDRGIISGEVTNPNGYYTTLVSNIHIKYYNNEIIPINFGENKVLKSGFNDYSTLFESYSMTNLNGLSINSDTGLISGTTSTMLGDGKVSNANTTTLSYTPKELTFDVRVKDSPKLNITNIQADKSYFDLTKSSFELNKYFSDSSGEKISYTIEKSSNSFGVPRGFEQDDQCYGNITGSLNDNIDNNAMKVKAKDILGQETEHTFILRYLLDQ
jgi:hypothetical protein